MTTRHVPRESTTKRSVQKALTQDHSGSYLWYRAFKHVIIGPALGRICPTTVEGLENIPSRGGVILACNHLSATDWLFIPLVMPRKVTHVAKREYFTGTGVKGAFQRWFFTSAGQIPIDRSGGNSSQSALNSLKKVVARGDVAAIYPEGTRSPDGRLYKGKTGVARLALESQVPVIPVGLIGTNKVLSPNSHKFHPHAVTVRFGAALDFSRFHDYADDYAVTRAITDEIVYKIMLLTGQEYVDEYAVRKKSSTDNQEETAFSTSQSVAAPH